MANVNGVRVRFADASNSLTRIRRAHGAENVGHTINEL